MPVRKTAARIFLTRSMVWGFRVQLAPFRFEGERPRSSCKIPFCNMMTHRRPSCQNKGVNAGTINTRRALANGLKALLQGICSAIWGRQRGTQKKKSRRSTQEPSPYDTIRSPHISSLMVREQPTLVSHVLEQLPHHAISSKCCARVARCNYEGGLVTKEGNSRLEGDALKEGGQRPPESHYLKPRTGGGQNLQNHKPATRARTMSPKSSTRNFSKAIAPKPTKYTLGFGLCTSSLSITLLGQPKNAFTPASFRA